MRFRFLEPVVMAALPLAFIAVPAAAQAVPIGAGQTVNGRLDKSDAPFTDDDGAGGTNSQLEVVLNESGRYVIQANSYAGGQTGAYTLSVESVGGDTGAYPSIGLGQTVTSRLDGNDPLRSDDALYEIYVYHGQVGEQVLITSSSSDVDAYLGWGRMEETGFTGEVYDDDGAGGTDAQLEVTVNGTGLFGMLVNSYTAGQTGAYTLTVEHELRRHSPRGRALTRSCQALQRHVLDLRIRSGQVQPDCRRGLPAPGTSGASPRRMGSHGEGVAEIAGAVSVMTGGL